MSDIKINLYVSPADAVRAGQTRSGVFQVPVTEAGLASLTEGERAALGVYITKPWEGGYSSNPNSNLNAPSDNPKGTWDAVVQALRAKLAKEAEVVAAERSREDQEAVEAIAEIKAGGPEACISHYGNFVPKWLHGRVKTIVEACPEVQAIYREAETISKSKAEAKRIESERAAVAELAARAKKEAEDKDNARRYADACAAFIATHGTPSQIARREEGLLHASELEDAIRDHLFAALEAVPRYDRLTKEDIAHTDECDGPDMKYSASDAEELDAEEYANLVKIRDLAPKGSTVKSRIHKAWCVADGCEDSEAVERQSVMVSVEWHGHTFSREYAGHEE